MRVITSLSQPLAAWSQFLPVSRCLAYCLRDHSQWPRLPRWNPLWLLAAHRVHSKCLAIGALHLTTEPTFIMLLSRYFSAYTLATLFVCLLVFLLPGNRFPWLYSSGALCHGYLSSLASLLVESCLCFISYCLDKNFHPDCFFVFTSTPNSCLNNFIQKIFLISLLRHLSHVQICMSVSNLILCLHGPVQ